MKRIVLFLLTNLAILLVLSLTMRLFGFDGYMTNAGYDPAALLVFAAVFGFGGAFISLLMSKWSAKRMTGARVIDRPATAREQWLVQTVERQAQAAGIAMPEVAIFPSADPNAFATGANKNAALVAVSEGLLQHMNEAEVEAVLGHEISHVANGDMVTLTLIQGVVNTFVIFFARVIGQFVDRAILKNERGVGAGYYLSVFVAEMVLGILASIIVMWFSRQREYRADAGGAALAGPQKMISALEALKRTAEQRHLPQQFAAFGINGGNSLGELFMSHPPLDKRIRALQNRF